MALITLVCWHCHTMTLTSAGCKNDCRFVRFSVKKRGHWGHRGHWQQWHVPICLAMFFLPGWHLALTKSKFIQYPCKFQDVSWNTSLIFKSLNHWWWNTSTPSTTLPKTNTSHLKMVGSPATSLLGRSIFRGELLISGSVSSNIAMRFRPLQLSSSHDDRLMA